MCQNQVELKGCIYPYMTDSCFCALPKVSYTLPCPQNAVNALYFNLIMQSGKEVAENVY